MNENPLENLRDIHLPLMPGWWPLGPMFWFLLGILVLLLLIFLAYFIFTKPKRLLKKKIILEIQNIEQEFLVYNDHSLAKNKLNDLLRRIVFSVYKNSELKSKNLKELRRELLKIFVKKKEIEHLLEILYIDRFQAKVVPNGDEAIAITKKLVRKCKL